MATVCGHSGRSSRRTAFRSRPFWLPSPALAGEGLGVGAYAPWKTGRRFSWKARRPSSKSREVTQAMK
jgi:hypothetical protein